MELYREGGWDAEAPLVNASARVYYDGTEANTPIVGMVVGNPAGATSTEPLGIGVRALSRQMAHWGLPHYNPKLRVFDTSSAPAGLIKEINDAKDLGSDFDYCTSRLQERGAAPVDDPQNTEDTWTYANLGTGIYSFHAPAENTAQGVVLMEAYLPSSLPPESKQIMNFSCRTLCGREERAIIAGFVVAGQAGQKKRLLIRAVGPGLSPGVSGVCPNPRIRLIRSTDQAVLAENDDWGSASNADEIEAVSAQVGASALDRSSHDAAILVTLDANTIATPVVEPADGTEGTVLVEVYRVPLP